MREPFLWLLTICLLGALCLAAPGRAQSTVFSSTGSRLSETVAQPPSDRTLADIASARRAIRLHPNSASDHLSLAKALYSLGEREAASAALDRALQFDPKLAQAWFQKGLIESDSGRPFQAADYFRRAVEFCSRCVAARLELGDMLLRLGDSEQAAHELDAVLRLDPRNSGAHYGMGMVHLQKGDFAVAETEFRRTLELNPNFGPAQQYMGVTLVQQHKWSDARLVLEQVLAANPQSLAAANAYATALASSGEKTRAAEEFQKVRELSRQQSALERAQGEIARGFELWHSGRLQEAAARFRTAIEARTDHADAHNDLGGVLLQLNDRAGALNEFRTAVHHNTAFAEAHNNLGSMLLDSGDIDRAIEQFSTAINCRPGFALAHYNLARALLNKKNLAQAEAELRQTVMLAPEMARAHIQLGLVLASQAKALSPDAKAELNDGLRLDSRLTSLIPAEYLPDLP